MLFDTARWCWILPNLFRCSVCKSARGAGGRKGGAYPDRLLTESPQVCDSEWFWMWMRRLVYDIVTYFMEGGGASDLFRYFLKDIMLSQNPTVFYFRCDRVGCGFCSFLRSFWFFCPFWKSLGVDIYAVIAQAGLFSLFFVNDFFVLSGRRVLGLKYLPSSRRRDSFFSPCFLDNSCPTFLR